MTPHYDSIADDVVNMGYEMLIEDSCLPYEEREYERQPQPTLFDIAPFVPLGQLQSHFDMERKGRG